MIYERNVIWSARIISSLEENDADNSYGQN